MADTVGCGDSFAAAVVMGYTRRHSIPALLALANAVGAATAMGEGAGADPSACRLELEIMERFGWNLSLGFRHTLQSKGGILRLVCFYAGRNVANSETVQDLLQQEADGSSSQPVVCYSDKEQQSLPVEPLAEEALSILRQSLSNQSSSNRERLGQLRFAPIWYS